jgi:hypothetical protein
MAARPPGANPIIKGPEILTDCNGLRIRASSENVSLLPVWVWELLSDSFGLFSNLRTLWVWVSRSANTPFSRLNALIHAAVPKEGVAWKPLNDREDIYPRMRLVAPCVQECYGR